MYLFINPLNGSWFRIMSQLCPKHIGKYSRWNWESYKRRDNFKRINIQIVKSGDRYYEDKRMGWGRNFFSKWLNPRLKEWECSHTKSRGETSRDQFLFAHSTNIYSALSLRQELFEVKKIYQWTKHTCAKLLRWERIWHVSGMERKPLRLNHTEQRRVWYNIRLEEWQQVGYVATCNS